MPVLATEDLVETPPPKWHLSPKQQLQGGRWWGGGEKSSVATLKASLGSGKVWAHLPNHCSDLWGHCGR